MQSLISWMDQNFINFSNLESNLLPDEGFRPESGFQRLEPPFLLNYLMISISRLLFSVSTSSRRCSATNLTSPPPFYPIIPCGFHLIWIADVPGKPGAGPGTHKIDSLVAAYLSPKRWRQRRDSDGNDFQRLPTDFKGSKGRRKGWRRHSLLSKAMQVIRI